MSVPPSWYSIFLTQTLALAFSFLFHLFPFLFLALFLYLFLMSLLESLPLREWGTRYDSLSTSPSPSTASSLSRLQQPTTCPSTANSSRLTPVAVSPTISRAQGNRLLHEASVFVGRCFHLPFLVAHMCSLFCSVSRLTLTMKS